MTLAAANALQRKDRLERYRRLRAKLDPTGDPAQARMAGRVRRAADREDVVTRRQQARHEKTSDRAAGAEDEGDGHGGSIAAAAARA